MTQRIVKACEKHYLLHKLQSKTFSQIFINDFSTISFVKVIVYSSYFNVTIYNVSNYLFLFDYKLLCIASNFSLKQIGKEILK